MSTKPDIDKSEKAPPKPFVCTYCGIHLSTYAAHRAEWEGCPSCGRLNTIEAKE